MDTAEYDLSFEERFGLIVDREWTARRNRRLERLLKEARLRLPACPEDINYRHPRGLDRSVMRSLVTCGWLDAHRNVVITGPTGVGKTFIACALADAACWQGFRTRYYGVSRLLGELTAARGDGTYPRLPSKLARTDLLVLDDWGLVPVSTAEARDLLEVIDDRAITRSALVASQLPLEPGTRSWPTPRWPTPSSTGSSTTPTRSSSRGSQCGRQSGPGCQTTSR